jgi:antitoxin component of MazEF toxin-antitoxin module
MPLVRKIIGIGKTSKGVILPKSWLDFLEEKHGKVEAVTMEVDGQLIIKPILKEDSNH